MNDQKNRVMLLIGIFLAAASCVVRLLHGPLGLSFGHVSAPYDAWTERLWLDGTIAVTLAAFALAWLLYIRAIMREAIPYLVTFGFTFASIIGSVTGQIHTITASARQMSGYTERFAATMNEFASLCSELKNNVDASTGKLDEQRQLIGHTTGLAGQLKLLSASLRGVMKDMSDSFSSGKPNGTAG